MERSFNINTMVAFLTVAREGSVSRAAAALNLTQPAVSHQLKRLSEETETQLFERTSTGLRLTPEGEKLVPKAEHVLHAFSDFKKSAKKYSERISGKLRIGTIVDPEFIRLGNLLSSLRNYYPDIETELSHGVSGEVLNRIQRKQLDAGFYLSSADDFEKIGEMTQGAVLALKLAEFSYRVVAPAGWSKEVENATWEKLAGLPWIGTPETSVHHRLLKKVFDDIGCDQNTVALVDQEASMLEMVRSGVGLSLSRESIALHQRQSFGLEICETVSVPALLSFVYSSQSRNSTAQDALLEIVKQVWLSANR
ncbi:LysR family transcriptional regulator [Celeribacter sp.]|uniref:LysR family transcriptional regulator n=1 Tax=Celeribacter sp. TaxID=1890673 RepID=UPI003A92E0C0